MQDVKQFLSDLHSNLETEAVSAGLTGTKFCIRLEIDPKSDYFPDEALKTEHKIEIVFWTSSRYSSESVTGLTWVEVRNEAIRRARRNVEVFTKQLPAPSQLDGEIAQNA